MEYSIILLSETVDKFSEPKTETEIIAFDKVRRIFINLKEIRYAKEVKVIEHNRETDSFEQVS